MGITDAIQDKPGCASIRASFHFADAQQPLGLGFCRGNHAAMLQGACNSGQFVSAHASVGTAEFSHPRTELPNVGYSPVLVKKAHDTLRAMPEQGRNRCQTGYPEQTFGFGMSGGSVVTRRGFGAMGGGPSA